MIALGLTSTALFSYGLARACSPLLRLLPVWLLEPAATWCGLWAVRAYDAYHASRRAMLGLPTDCEVTRVFRLREDADGCWQAERCCWGRGAPGDVLAVSYVFGPARREYSVLVDADKAGALQAPVPYTAEEVAEYAAAHAPDPEFLYVEADGRDVTDDYLAYYGPKLNAYADVPHALFEPGLMLDASGQPLLAGARELVAIDAATLERKHIRLADEEQCTDPSNDHGSEREQCAEREGCAEGHSDGCTDGDWDAEDC